jgi:hypothetical protein
VRRSYRPTQIQSETVAMSGAETHGLWVRFGADVVVIEATGFRPGARMIDAAAQIGERLAAQ